ncbi:MAG: glycosyltransferase [Gammaproteobacteria bacterium]|jgi:uncharacterized protein|nr:glycosyltransferase [Gammaproteobacteria bacterium]MCH1550434.1 TIGR04282 family arsenosugar biosynthesis glycosyltransferase [Pseudomonadales bacterium]
MTQRYALAVMARTPRAYKTKTRLATALGHAGAMRAHIQLVEDTLSRLTQMPNIDTSLWVTEIDAQARQWANTFQVALCEQPAGDLGQKMHAILAHMLIHGCDLAALVGTDCPSIDQAYVERGFQALSGCDVAVGPAEDGGYGFIGVSRECPQLFAHIDWGSDAVFSQTKARVAESALDLITLPTIWDVDDPADWARYQKWKARSVQD